MEAKAVSHGSLDSAKYTSLLGEIPNSRDGNGNQKLITSATNDVPFPFLFPALLRFLVFGTCKNLENVANGQTRRFGTVEEAARDSAQYTVGS